MPTSITWPRPVCLAVAQRDHDADRAEQAGDVVAQRHRARQHRRLAGKAGQVVEPAERLRDVREAGAAAIGPGLAVARDAQHHQPRVGGAHAPSQPSPHSSIVPGRKFSISTSDLASSFRNSCDAFGLPQVDGDGLAVARLAQPLERGIGRAVAVPKRRIGSPAMRVLDLEHLGAELAQHRRGIGTGQEIADIDHAHAAQRQ